MGSGETIYTGGNPLDYSALARFIVQLLIVVSVAKLLSYAIRLLKQPSVIAEVATGILLGPSVMGFVPGFTANIFKPSSMDTFDVVSNLGIILYMFLIGLEMDIGLLKQNLISSLVISFSAMAIPFGMGVGVSFYLWREIEMTDSATFAAFMLFVGVAISITALPVLARILTDQDIAQSRVGVIALSSAAVDDVVAWLMLAIVVSIARSSGPLVVLYTLIASAGYTILMIVVIRPILGWLALKAHTRNNLQHEFVVLVLLMLFASSWVTEIIGVHSMFGGFLFGCITPRTNRFAIRMTERIEDLIVGIFLPLYFTYSGLRTDLSELNTYQSGVMVLLIIAASMLGKVGGGTLAARLFGNTWRESLTIGVLLNTKGLVELVVLNVGLDIGVLTRQVFSAFVVMALWNTFLTTPAVYLLWTRHDQKKAKLKRKGNNYSVVVCIPEPRLGVSMVTVAGTLAKAQARLSDDDNKWKPKIHALHLTEVSERPSTYFFRLRLDKVDAVEFARQRAAQMDVRFQITTKLSVDISADLSKIANARPRDLVILGWNQHMSHISEGGTRVHSLMHQIEAPIGILVDKGTLRDLTSIKRVMLIYSFHNFEMEAIQVALQLARDPTLQLTILVPHALHPHTKLLHLPETQQNDSTSSGDDVLDGSIAGNTPDPAHQQDEAHRSERSVASISCEDYFDILVLGKITLSLLRRCVRFLGRAIRSRRSARRKKRRRPQPHEHRMEGSEDTDHEKGLEMKVPSAADVMLRPASSSTDVIEPIKRRASSGGSRSDSSSRRASEAEGTDSEQLRLVSPIMMDDLSKATTYDGLLELIKHKPNVTLAVADGGLFDSAMERQASERFEMVIIGNERKWSNAQHDHLHHASRSFHDDEEDDDEEEDVERGREERRGGMSFIDFLSCTSASLLVVHPVLKEEDRHDGIFTNFLHFLHSSTSDSGPALPLVDSVQADHQPPSARSSFES